MQDFVFRDEMANFDRERIPERVVHAKGSGAFGYFQVTHDITSLTRAKVFSKIGKKTPILVRFSTVGGEKGSADTVRDPRGFAIKFYTEEGNWDLTGLNQPVFFINDALQFPSLIHSQKRNPVTDLMDATMFWDFATLRPETLHMLTFIFSDVGIPKAYSLMDGFGVHSFRFVNAQQKGVFVKFHLVSQQGVQNLTVADAVRLAGEDPDYNRRELFDRIARGQFPEWKMFVQVMTPKEAERFALNPFDPTVLWPIKDFPLVPVGRLVLNKNPSNAFAEIEQAAFCPAHLVPGIEPSPDKLLQGRLFSYADTQRYRVGTNHLLLPVNRPRVPVKNYQRDGTMMFTNNQGGAPNYFPNSFNGPQPDPVFIEAPLPATGPVFRFNDSVSKPFLQPGIRFRQDLDAGAQQRLINNLAGSIQGAAQFIQERAVRLFTKIDKRLGSGIAVALKRLQRRTQKVAQNSLERPTGDWRENIFYKYLPNVY
jgi:catalase